MAMWIDEPLPAVVVEVINGWGTTPRRAAGEHDEPYPDVASVAARLALPAEATSRLTDEVLVGAADGLYPVFATTDLATRADLVSGLLESAGIRPALRTADGRLRAAWVAVDARSALVGAGALALRSHLARSGGHRLGICAGYRCADAYLDASPTGQRRFCSLTCQNRARVAAFRRRRSGTAG